MVRGYYIFRFSITFVSVLAVAVFSMSMRLHAEYGDVVINNFSDKQEMRPVIFPHWFHRIRFRCKACHVELGMKMQAGGNQITMNAILDGQYCGACHNGEIAWSPVNCDLCHSANPGTKTQVMGGHETNGPGYY